MCGIIDDEIKYALVKDTFNRHEKIKGLHKIENEQTPSRSINQSGKICGRSVTKLSSLSKEAQLASKSI